MPGYRDLDRLVHADGVAVAVCDARLAAVADFPFEDRIRLQLGIGQQDGEALARPELRREKNLAPADLAQTGEIGREAKMYQHIGVGLAVRRRPAPPFAEVAGHRIDGLAAVGVEHGNGFVSLVLEQARQVPQHHRPVHLIQRGVTHRGVIAEKRALLDPAQRAARDAES